MSSGVDKNTDFDEDVSGKGASVTYPIIFIMGIVANCSVLLTIVLSRRLSRTLVLIANMSTADLLMLFTGCYLRYYDRFETVASKWFCRVFNAGDIMFLQISSLSILSMAYERFLKVTDRGSISREMEYKSQLLVCAIIWATGFVVSSPALIYSDLHESVIACIATWTESFGIRYQISLFFATYCLPGVLIGIIYSFIIYKTKSVLSVLSGTTVYQSRIVRMLTSLVILFWAFHFPFWLCTFRFLFGSVQMHCSSFWMESAIVFTYVNAAANPFLYAIMTTTNCTLSGFTCDFAFEENYSHEDEQRQGDTDPEVKSGSGNDLETDQKNKRQTEELQMNDTGATSFAHRDEMCDYKDVQQTCTYA